MKDLATRMSLIQPSPTLALTAKAKAMKADGLDVIGFGAGEPDFDTPQHIKDAAIEAINSGQTKYTPVPGTVELKDAVIYKLNRDNDLTYSRDQIIIGNGGKHCLYNVFMALLNEGDEVLIPAPYWVSYPDMVAVSGGKSVILPSDDSTEFKVTAQQIDEAANSKTKILVLNSPSNPTGSAYTKDELNSILAMCEKHDLYIVSDEIYEHLVYDGYKHISIASLSEDAFNRTIICSGASKCYSMTGWRMGFAAGPANIIKAMGKLQSQSTSNVCSITQAACVAAFKGSLEPVQTMLKAFDERRQYLVQALNNIDGITCLTPKGAFYVFPNVTGLIGKQTPNGKTIESSQDFCLYMLEEHQVAIVHGEAFGAPGFMRMSYATDLETIKRGVERIQNAVSTLK